MKIFNKLLVGILVLAIVAGMAGCVKETPAETVATADGTTETIATETTVAETTIAVESTDVTEASIEGADQELPITDANGAKTIDGLTFETMYGSQLINYLNHQYYFDDIKIPKAEANFYFIHAFKEISREASVLGYYPVTSEGYVDLSYPFVNGQIGNFSFDTFGDYFREYSENMILSTYIVISLANEQGVFLSDETVAEIDDYMVILDQTASAYGLTLDEYLAIFYGPDMDKDTFRGILDRYYLSTLYSEEYVANYVFDDEELYAPRICHALFLALEGTSSEEDMNVALEGAQVMLEECEKPEDILTIGNALMSSGIVIQCEEYNVQSSSVPELESLVSWAYDPERQVGDMDIVQTSFGYNVVGYLGADELSEEEKNSVALLALNDEIGAIAFSKVHEFYTEDEIITPSPVGTEEPTTVETTEINPSINLDEDGNIVIEDTTPTTTVLSVTPTPPVVRPKFNALNITSIVVGIIAFILSGIFIGLSIAKGRENGESKSKAKASSDSKAKSDDKTSDKE
ncbi:MAG: hypothetical protein MJ166_04280 [Clostridia bacterium]|nr:hypothetical protein [Clostridia bacterium]